MRACLGPVMLGSGSLIWSVLVGELLMPQPVLRHIARRAVQLAIVAAGIFGRLAGVIPTGPGMPGWPIILADYHQVVVTRCPGDGTVCVLRPPGTAAEAILRAARLILPEDPYQELASQLGVPAGLPMTI
jgi:hypothetical protein